MAGESPWLWPPVTTNAVPLESMQCARRQTRLALLVYSTLQALGKAQERTRRARETLSFRVSLSRAPFFLAYYFQAPATQHKNSRGRAIYSELGDVCMQADTQN